MHAKSIGEFRLTWDSAIAQSKLWSQPSIFESIRKKWLALFGWSQSEFRSDSLRKRL